MLKQSNFNPTPSQKASICIVILAASFTLSKSAHAVLVTRNIGVTLNASTLDSYNLDVDQNGTNDFTFQAAYVPDPVLTVGFDQINFLFGSNNAAVIDTQTGDGFPPTSLLSLGQTISSSSLFSGPNDTADLFYDDTFDPTTGNFNGNTGFVGFRFAAPDGTHFGYAQVSVTNISDPTNPLNLTLGTVVYNDLPNVPVQIAAIPEPTLLAPILFSLPALLRRNRKSK